MPPYDGDHGTVTDANDDGWDEKHYNSYDRKVYLKDKCTNINNEKRKKIWVNGMTNIPADTKQMDQSQINSKDVKKKSKTEISHFQNELVNHQFFYEMIQGFILG